jgi:hypothetical protein
LQGFRLPKKYVDALKAKLQTTLVTANYGHFSTSTKLLFSSTPAKNPFGESIKILHTPESSITIQLIIFRPITTPILPYPLSPISFLVPFVFFEISSAPSRIYIPAALNLDAGPPVPILSSIHFVQIK